jgi:hypothetical protein
MASGDEDYLEGAEALNEILDEKVDESLAVFKDLVISTL